MPKDELENEQVFRERGVETMPLPFHVKPCGCCGAWPCVLLPGYEEDL